MVITSQRSALGQVLLALVPYTRENLALTFRPHQFFNDLERTSQYSSATLRASYNRAKRRRLVFETGSTIELSLEARHDIQPFIAQTISDGQLMVIFDIPEDFSDYRRKFRLVLRKLGFQQVQQSVWMSNKDHRALLTETISTYHFDDWVQLYEAQRIET